MTNSNFSGRRKIIKDSSKFLAATVLAQGIGMIRGLMMPVLFNPAQLGIWNLMGGIIGYGGNATFGLVHGMNKAIPLLRGQGNEVGSEEVKDSVFWMIPLIAVLAAGILGCFTIWAPAEYRPSMLIVAAVIFLQQFFIYIYSLLRADGRFGLVSQGVGIQAVCSVGLILLFAMGLPDRLVGALMGVAGGYILILIFWFVKGHYRFPIKIKIESIRKALAFGVPVFVIGILDSVFVSVDRWLIVTSLGEESVGYYALGLMVGNLLGLVPGSVASVLYPNMLARFGSGKDVRAGRNLLVGPFMVLSAFMLILVSVAVLGVPLIIQLFLAKYIPSIPIIRILAPGMFFWALSNLPSTYLVSINKQNWIMVVQIAVMIFVVVVGSFVLWRGNGILEIALVTSSGYAIYGLCLTVLTFRLIFKRSIDLFPFLLRFLVPFVVMVMAIGSVDLIVSDEVEAFALVLMTLERLIFVLSPLGIVLWLMNRKSEAFLVGLDELKNWIRARQKAA